jgi:SAM-dependent methyltransferase
LPTSKDIVRRGYNRISQSYQNDRGAGPDAKYQRYWFREVDKRLPRGSRILELGCGMGVPVAKLFSRRHSYLGVDISDVQIRRAKKLVPLAKFQRADMARLRLKSSSFDAVLAFYSILHLPLREHKPLFKRIFSWLKPGGVFLSVLGWGRWTGKEKNWYGAPMFFSHTDEKTYHRWLEGIGFKVIRKALIRERKGGHFQFLCVKPGE